MRENVTVQVKCRRKNLPRKIDRLAIGRDFFGTPTVDGSIPLSLFFFGEVVEIVPFSDVVFNWEIFQCFFSHPPMPEPPVPRMQCLVKLLPLLPRNRHQHIPRVLACRASLYFIFPQILISPNPPPARRLKSLTNPPNLPQNGTDLHKATARTCTYTCHTPGAYSVYGNHTDVIRPVPPQNPGLTRRAYCRRHTPIRAVSPSWSSPLSCP